MLPRRSKLLPGRCVHGDDCDRAQCTIEEREEYEQHISNGVVVYAGVDYARILAAVEKEADVILWDGGNNDWPFFRSDLEIVLLDPHRAGHELLYHPGETNLRRAQVLVIKYPIDKSCAFFSTGFSQLVCAATNKRALELRPRDLLGRPCARPY